MLQLSHIMVVKVMEGVCINLPRSHIFLSSSHLLKQWMAEFFRNKIPINYFRFFRIYSNGNCIRLSSNEEWNHLYLVKGLMKINNPIKIFTSPTDEIKYIPNNSTNIATAVNLGAEMFDYCNGLSIKKRKNNYIDIYDFTTSKCTSNPEIMYLENLYLLEEFIRYFHLKGSDIILEAEKSALSYIEDEQFKNNLSFVTVKEQITKQKIKLSIKYADRIFTLTSRELEVLSYISTGLQCKQIANELHLSARTVETIINNIKDKFNVHSTSILQMNIAKEIELSDLLHYLNRCFIECSNK